MTGSHDRRIHADALHKQQQGRSLADFKRQAIAMLVCVALGGVSLPCWLAGHEGIVATETYHWAEIKLWAVSGWAKDVICPLLSGPKSLLFWTRKELENGQEAQAGGDYRQAA